IYMPVCHESGYKAGKDCIHVDTILVSESAVNAPVCPYHRIIHLDETGNYRVTEKCEMPYNMKHVSWFILPPTVEYYYKQNHADYKTLPPFKDGCTIENLKTLDIIYPKENAKIYVPLEVSGEKGRTIFTATAKNKSNLFWHLDDEYIATTENFHHVAVNPAEGKHILTVVNEDGEMVTRNFEILDKNKNE
ncbi:MAG: penicillin-binding protein 1C, partial [Parafilimonas sp.]